jgi:hypothetical protein
MIDIDDTCLLWDVNTGLQDENERLRRLVQQLTGELRESEQRFNLAKKANDFLQTELMYAGLK